MEILVCVKQVADTATKVQVGADGRSLDESGVKFILNPYDEYAVEDALRLKEAHGGTVTVLTLGGERADQALRTALAMGADAAKRIDGPVSLDPLQAARAVAKALEGQTYDLILCGKQAVDGDGMVFGPALATLLGIPAACNVTALEVVDGQFKATRQVEGGEEDLDGPLPILVTRQKGGPDPRYPTMMNIMKARRKTIELVPAVEAAAGGQVTGMAVPPPKTGGARMVTGETAADQAKELVRLLREEAKVI